MQRSLKAWRGLKDLVVDAVAHGSEAVERVHLGTSKRTFDILEQVPVVELPAKGIHLVHDISVRGVYGAIRMVTRAAGTAADVAFDLAEREVDGDVE